MIRQGAELHASSKKSNGTQNGGVYEDAIDNDMELDDEPAENNWDQMETEENYQFDYAQLLEETLNYGRLLQAEFKDDPRKEIKKALDEAFALFAYEDPTNAKEVAHLLHHSERVSVAEELNSAILGEQTVTHAKDFANNHSLSWQILIRRARTSISTNERLVRRPSRYGRTWSVRQHR